MDISPCVLYMNDTAKNFMPNGSIGGSVTLSGGVGLGASGVAGVSGGIDGKLGINYDIYQRKQNYLAITGSIGAYAKAFVGPFEYKKPFNFAQGTIWDYPSTKAKTFSLFSEESIYNTAEYELIDRSYAENPSEFMANDTGIRLFSAEAQNKYEQILKTNIYTYSEPQLVELENGNMLAVWLDDDATRNAINRTSLYYSYYDGTWSQPQAVNDDRTADFAPYLTKIDNKARLVWVNTKNEFENNAEISDVCAAWEICNAEFNNTTKQFENINSITSNNDTDMMPTIFGDNENVYIT